MCVFSVDADKSGWILIWDLVGRWRQLKTGKRAVVGLFHNFALTKKKKKNKETQTEKKGDIDFQETTPLQS